MSQRKEGWGSLASQLKYILDHHALSIEPSGEVSIIGLCSCDNWERKVGALGSRHTVASAVSTIERDHSIHISLLNKYK